MKTQATSQEGVVYLLHLSRKLHHCQHYMGWSHDLGTRIEAHRQGRGSRLCEVISELGITFEVARTWTGDRHLERKLKRRHEGPRLCPICRRERSHPEDAR
jgi:predicted GIY-YIG superfamily endonuclease